MPPFAAGLPFHWPLGPMMVLGRSGTVFLRFSTAVSTAFSVSIYFQPFRSVLAEALATPGFFAARFGTSFALSQTLKVWGFPSLIRERPPSLLSSGLVILPFRCFLPIPFLPTPLKSAVNQSMGQFAPRPSHHIPASLVFPMGLQLPWGLHKR